MGASTPSTPSPGSAPQRSTSRAWWTVPATTIGALEVEAARIIHTDDSYGFRVTGDGGRSRDSSTRATAAGRRTSTRSSGPGTRCCARCRSDPVRSTPGAAHLDGPAVGALAARSGAGRVLLTHLQMGFDEGATIDSVRAAYDGPVALVWPGERYVIGG